MAEGSKMTKRLGFFVAVVAILIFAAITSYNYWRYRNLKAERVLHTEVVPVEISKARIMTLKHTLELTGDIKPIMEVYVNPKVPGKIIEKILVEKGDLVRKGDLIATLEKDTIRAQIEEARARLVSAESRLNEVNANLELVRKDRKRLKNLFKKRAVSQQKLDQVNAKYTAMLATRRLAESQIDTARASLNVLQIMLKDHDVRSPITGHISARFMDAGNMSNPSKPIVRVSKEDTVKIVASITERDYPLIKKGMRAVITVDSLPDRVFEGRISVINPTLDPATRTAQIEIHIDNKALMLRAGMFAHIRLSVGQREALVIPRDALNRLPGTGSYYVFCAQQGKALLKNVKVGELQGNYAEIIGGLKKGEMVIVKGQNRVRDGTPIKVLKEIPGRAQN